VKRHVLLIVAALLHLAAVPVALPPNESSADWDDALAPADLVAGTAERGVAVAIIDKGDTWVVLLVDDGEPLRREQVAAPTTATERQDFAWLVQSLVSDLARLREQPQEATEPKPAPAPSIVAVTEEPAPPSAPILPPVEPDQPAPKAPLPDLLVLDADEVPRVPTPWLVEGGIGGLGLWRRGLGGGMWLDAGVKHGWMRTGLTMEWTAPQNAPLDFWTTLRDQRSRVRGRLGLALPAMANGHVGVDLDALFGLAIQRFSDHEQTLPTQRLASAGAHAQIWFALHPNLKLTVGSGIDNELAEVVALGVSGETGSVPTWQIPASLGLVFHSLATKTN
jgi:hypothetical protein